MKILNIEKGKHWIPHHLQTLLKTLVISEVKQIGHAIVQSSRPRSVITPTLFGVGVEMDHVFGSKWLINLTWVFLLVMSYHDEFHWQYWPNDERLWIVRGFRNYLRPKCSHSFLEHCVGIF